MLQTAIVFRKAGEAIPQEQIKKFLEYNKACMGMAVRVNDGKPEIVIVRTADADCINVEAIEQAQTEFFNTEQVFVFGNVPEGVVSEEDIQPYTVLVDSEDNPLIVAAMDGNFPSYELEKSSHHAQYHAAMHMGNKLSKWYVKAKLDFDGLMNELKDPDNHVDFNNMVVGAGAIVLLTITGECLVFGQNEALIQERSWGWATKTYESVLTDVKEPVKKAEKPPEKKSYSFAKKTTETPKPTVTQVGATTVIINPSPPSVPTLVKKDDDDPLVWVTPPTNRDGKQLRIWYTDVAGVSKPNNWQSRPKVQIPMSKAISAGIYKVEGTTVTSTTPKDMKADEPKAVVREFSPGPTRHVDPTIVNNCKEWLAGSQVKGFIERWERNSKENPVMMNDLETKTRCGTELMGVTLEEVLRWPPGVWSTMAEKFPRMAMSFIKEFGDEIMRLRTKQSSIETAGTLEPKKEVEEKKVNVTPAQEQKSKTTFSFKKSA